MKLVHCRDTHFEDYGVYNHAVLVEEKPTEEQAIELQKALNKLGGSLCVYYCYMDDTYNLYGSGRNNEYYNPALFVLKENQALVLTVENFEGEDYLCIAEPISIEEFEERYEIA